MDKEMHKKRIDIFKEDYFDFLKLFEMENVIPKLKELYPNALDPRKYLEVNVIDFVGFVAGGAKEIGDTEIELMSIASNRPDLSKKEARNFAEKLVIFARDKSTPDTLYMVCAVNKMMFEIYGKDYGFYNRFVNMYANLKALLVTKRNGKEDADRLQRANEYIKAITDHIEFFKDRPMIHVTIDVIEAKSACNRMLIFYKNKELCDNAPLPPYCKLLHEGVLRDAVQNTVIYIANGTKMTPADVGLIDHLIDYDIGVEDMLLQARFKKAAGLSPDSSILLNVAKSMREYLLKHYQNDLNIFDEVTNFYKRITDLVVSFDESDGRRKHADSIMQNVTKFIESNK